MRTVVKALMDGNVVEVPFDELNGKWAPSHLYGSEEDAVERNDNYEIVYVEIGSPDYHGEQRHNSLPADLDTRCRALFRRLRSSGMFTDYQEFRYTFLCDEHPQNEIAIVERIAQCYLAFAKRYPRFDKRLLHATLCSISFGQSEPFQGTGWSRKKMAELLELWAAATEENS